MKPVILERQLPIESLDEATASAVAKGIASARRGDLVTLDQSTINLRKRLEAWRKAKNEVALTA